MTPAIQFLINCCKTRPTTSDIEQIRKYIKQLNNQQLWEMVILAHAHGIFPLVYQAIREHASELLTDDTLNELKHQNMSIVMQNMHMTAELIRIMRLLEENGIEALAFKGPTLAQLAYGDITLRQYGDLDILIKQEDIYRIDALLTAQEYKRLFTLTPVQEKAWIKHSHEIGFVQSKNNIHLDIHWLLLDNDYPLQFELDTEKKHLNTVTINGQNIKTFPTEDLLIYLCIHGSKHLWERIGWIKDIDLMIRTQTIDWEKLAVKLNNSRFERMFLLGLFLSNHFFQTPLPTIFRQQLKDKNWLKKLNRFVSSDWQHHRNMFHNSVAMLQLFPTLKMKLLYLLKVIIKPSRNEYRYIDLPERMYWIYYLVRPYMLTKKYLSKN